LNRVIQVKTKQPTYPATRAAGTRSLPCAHFARFTEAQNARLHEHARAKGQPIQGFLHDAAMAAMDAMDRLESERESFRSKRAPLQDPSAPPERSRGFGLREKLERMAPVAYPEAVEEAEAEDAPPAAPPQIVINTGSTPASSSAQVDSLAAWVVKAPSDKRDERLRAAVDILSTSAANDTERERLAKELDTKLSSLGVKKSFSVFDVFDSFLK
jgi:hypothetical protein